MTATASCSRCRSSASGGSARSRGGRQAPRRSRSVLEPVSEAGLLSVAHRRARTASLPGRASRRRSYGRGANEELRSATAGRAAGLFAPRPSTTGVLHRLPALAGDRLGLRRWRPTAGRSTARRAARPGRRSATGALEPDARRRRSRVLPVLQRRRAPGERRAARRLAGAGRPRRAPSRDDPGGSRGAAQGLLRAGGAAARDLSPGEEQSADHPEPAPPRLARPRAGPARALRERDPPHRRHGAGAHAPLQARPTSPRSTSRNISRASSRRSRRASAPSMRGIRTELEVEPMRVPLDTAVPLAFITVEILTNAFKHAFPDRARRRRSRVSAPAGSAGKAS